MNDKYYTSERGTLILIALLKAHGIRKIIASPGTTNHTFVGSVQRDPDFEVYSSVDERSAAYMACGMAAESGEPVVITCTGATASRNYLSGMTEAYYRKLPVIAITYNAGIDKRHHLIAQQIDRSLSQIDARRMAVSIPLVKDSNDAWYANVEINKALLASTDRGGGPVHIDISTGYSHYFDVKALPKERVIRRLSVTDPLPPLPCSKTVVKIGSHRNFTKEETEAIDLFCAQNNAVVLCDHTSGYYGQYRVQSSLIAAQNNSHCLTAIDLLIHLGEVSGDYETTISPSKVWRVNPDGEIKDTFRTLQYVFSMSELEFFRLYTQNCPSPYADNSLLKECNDTLTDLYASIPELPFSNIWIAGVTAGQIPENSVIHLGILNTLRSWNYFCFPKEVKSYCNVGGFGIDGALSTILGASLTNPDKLYFAVVGDLAFFYDLNALGNRHKLRNLRILLINNGRGTEFTNYSHPCHAFGTDADAYMAAAGHFGNQSTELIKNFTRDLGFSYLSAHTKEEYLEQLPGFVSPESAEHPMVFEVFTDSTNESDALKAIRNIKEADTSAIHTLSSAIQQRIAGAIGDKGRKIIKILKE